MCVCISLVWLQIGARLIWRLLDVNVKGSQMLIENSSEFLPSPYVIFIAFSPFLSSQYECKVQNLKKRKVTIQISVNGVRVVLKKRRRKVSTKFPIFIFHPSIIHIASIMILCKQTDILFSPSSIEKELDQ